EVPVTISRSQTYNGQSAIVTRQTDVRVSGFSVKLQEEQGNDGLHSTESIGYMAVEGLINRAASEDIIKPIVDEFFVNPTTVNINEEIIINWAVTDETSLNRVELWRTTDNNGFPNENNWNWIKTKSSSGTFSEGNFIDSISTVGTYWYGIHVVDEAENIGFEPTVASVVVDTESVNLPKLVVSSDGHYLETEDGEPFMWISETLWYMVQRTKRENVTYLLDRLAGITDPNLGGTTAIKATVAMRLDIREPQNPVNAYGHVAFNGGAVPDFTSPKIVAGGGPDAPNDYWDHLDFIVREAKERGMYFMMVPLWSNAYVHGTYGSTEITAATARAYGEFLGNRYSNEDHILWMLGGDGKAFVGKESVYRSMAEGILKGVTGCSSCPAYNEPNVLWDEVLMTYHGNAYDSSSSDFWDLDVEKWCNIDGVYGGRFGNINEAYNLANPIIETEGYGFWICTEDQLGRQRAHHYAHWLSGGKGPEYMSKYIWNFEDGWKEHLSIPERVQITIMKSIMNSVAWHKLVPDQGIVLSANSFSD
ncbi:MAG: DUF4038 domain-containing protein, partial [Cyclobacteriaceae bacterium]|nr:DUF4038 domain-containing protein [Cyclobacteriaceae bacterium]